MTTQSYANSTRIVAEADTYERAWFIQKTYTHLIFAILGFVAIEAIIFSIPGLSVRMTRFMFGGQFTWLIVLLLFMGISHMAEKWARSDVSREQQYMGLALYVIAEAIIFVPLLFIARYYAKDPYLIHKAGLVTLVLFGALTFIAFNSKKDFSFLGGMLTLCGFIALGMIIASIIFGFHLGSFFAGFMVLFAGGCILYDTSNIIHHYRTEQYVAAALGLFASIALMFWYILQLFMSRD